MERTLVRETTEKIGQEVMLDGWVVARRDHGKIVFLVVGDRSGQVQVVASSRAAGKAGAGDAVEVIGTVKPRPDKLINLKMETGRIELEGKEVRVLARSEVYPFDMGKPELDLELPTLLDNRALTLRHSSIKQVFEVQAALLSAFRDVATRLGAMEIVVPTIAASATEGGAEVFKVDYFGFPAYLTQSPQLYKQVLVAVFERVYAITKAYRAEPSMTTRHLTESTQLDCEFAFASFPELLDLLEEVCSSMLKRVEERCKGILERMAIPPIAFGKIPRLKLAQAQEIIYRETGRDVRGEKDMAPQDEADICAWALREHHSDLVTITHFPTNKRAFYTMPDPADPEFSLSYDLLFRGVEMSSGSQRISDYQQLVAAIKDRGMDPENFEMYLMAFKYGMPPEGGFSFGLERLTKSVLNLPNIRQASLFPRDMERVDVRLATLRAEADEGEK